MVTYAENAYPVILKNITRSPDPEFRVIKLSKDYKDTNCCVIYSPVQNAALVITRTGSVKLANCAPGRVQWTIHPLSKEKLDHMEPWRYCSLGFSQKGLRAVALDRKGKLVVIKFTAGSNEKR